MFLKTGFEGFSGVAGDITNVKVQPEFVQNALKESPSEEMVQIARIGGARATTSSKPTLDSRRRARANSAHLLVSDIPLGIKPLGR